MFRLRSLPATLLSAFLLLCVAAFCHHMAIGKDASMLLLLVIVLGVSRLEGLVSGLIATALAALILVVWFFPPLGSAIIKSSSDRLALALFLLIATMGSRVLARPASSVS